LHLTFSAFINFKAVWRLTNRDSRSKIPTMSHACVRLYILVMCKNNPSYY